MSLPRESQVLRGVNFSLVEKEKGETYYLVRFKTDRWTCSAMANPIRSFRRPLKS
jgi:hypothetical protein